MKIVTKLDIHKWNEFLINHPYNNIFQSYEMYEVYTKSNKYEPLIIGVVEDDDTIIGVLLALTQKEKNGVLGFFTARSIIIGGPLIKDNNLIVLDLILKEYKEKIKNKVIYSQFRNMWNWTDDEMTIFLKNGFDYEDHLNIIVNLDKDENELWRDIKKNRKEGIRKAERNKLTFEESNSKEVLHSFYNLLKESYSEIKLPYPDFDFFENLIEKISPDNVKIFILKKEERIIVALFAFVYNKRLSAFYIGTTNDEDILKMRPVDLFYWEVIKWGNKNQCLIFDWMGAGKPNVDYGVRQFKLQFGGDLVNHGRHQIILKPLMYKLGVIGLQILSKIKK